MDVAIGVPIPGVVYFAAEVGALGARPINADANFTYSYFDC